MLQKIKALTRFQQAAKRQDASPEKMLKKTKGLRRLLGGAAHFSSCLQQMIYAQAKRAIRGAPKAAGISVDVYENKALDSELPILEWMYMKKNDLSPTQP